MYDIKWRRPGDPEVLECHGLTPEMLVFRLRAVVRMCGSVELLQVTPAGATAASEHLDFWYADGYQDGFRDGRQPRTKDQ